MTPDPIVIVGAARTPLGGFQGDLSPLGAPQLGAAAIGAARAQAGIEAGDVTEVFMGCVLPAGQGQAPARQAALGAGIPEGVGSTTLNKMCGSGMKAAMLANDLIAAGTARIMIAGGMESMSNAPYLLPKARTGYRMGHGQVVDHMFLDGLEDAYDKGRLMGTFAEDTARHYQFTREAQPVPSRPPRRDASRPKSPRSPSGRGLARPASRPTNSPSRRTWPRSRS
jgi:acetyl-CoA C-acetyltransferase